MFSNDDKISESRVNDNITEDSKEEKCLVVYKDNIDSGQENMKQETFYKCKGSYKDFGKCTDPRIIHYAFLDFQNRIIQSGKAHIPYQEIYRDQCIRQYATKFAPLVSVMEQIIFRNYGVKKTKGTEAPFFQSVVSYYPYYCKDTSDPVDVSMAENYIDLIHEHYNNYIHNDCRTEVETMETYGQQILELQKWKKKNSRN